jgi:hypothetical protein
MTITMTTHQRADLFSLWLFSTEHGERSKLPTFNKTRLLLTLIVLFYHFIHYLHCSFQPHTPRQSFFCLPTAASLHLSLVPIVARMRAFVQARLSLPSALIAPESPWLQQQCALAEES